jgi:hypothetical protein
MFYQETAQGSCCAQVTMNAFAKFGKREFIGWRLPKENKMHWLTYDDVFWHTKRVVFGLREICKPREFALICADLSPAYLLINSIQLYHFFLFISLHFSSLTRLDICP